MSIHPVKLSRDEFTAKYFPRYVAKYRPDYRIKLNKYGRPTRTTPGSMLAQQTKRDNRVDEGYADYLAIFESNERGPQ